MTTIVVAVAIGHSALAAALVSFGKTCVNPMFLVPP
jgi:hypothetical protein